jgi:DNA-directed RNA polymerase subunit RPC12/RpoP
MSISLSCPNCLKTYRVGDDKIGRSITCKECGTRITIAPTKSGSSSTGTQMPSLPARKTKKSAANSSKNRSSGGSDHAIWIAGASIFGTVLLVAFGIVAFRVVSTPVTKTGELAAQPIGQQPAAEKRKARTEAVAKDPQVELLIDREAFVKAVKNVKNKGFPGMTLMVGNESAIGRARSVEWEARFKSCSDTGELQFGWWGPIADGVKIIEVCQAKLESIPAWQQIPAGETVLLTGFYYFEPFAIQSENGQQTPVVLAFLKDAVPLEPPVELDTKKTQVLSTFDSLKRIGRELVVSGGRNISEQRRENLIKLISDMKIDPESMLMIWGVVVGAAGDAPEFVIANVRAQSTQYEIRDAILFCVEQRLFDPETCSRVLHAWVSVKDTPPESLIESVLSADLDQEARASLLVAIIENNDAQLPVFSFRAVQWLAENVPNDPAASQIAFRWFSRYLSQLDWSVLEVSVRLSGSKDGLKDFADVMQTMSAFKQNVPVGLSGPLNLALEKFAEAKLSTGARGDDQWVYVVDMLEIAVNASAKSSDKLPFVPVAIYRAIYHMSELPIIANEDSDRSPLVRTIRFVEQVEPQLFNKVANKESTETRLRGLSQTTTTHISEAARNALAHLDQADAGGK